MINVAIDGPAGAGKSTVARAAAKELGYIYVDTGALYRAVGVYGLRHGIPTDNGEKISAILPEIKVELNFIDGVQHVFLNGDDVSEEIRLPEASMAASNVSAIPLVRAFLFDLQREIAAKNNCIMDGRDIGTVVLPSATVKIFITADSRVRAQRRYKELLQRGEEITYEKVLRDIQRRDYRDSHRRAAPLKQAEDAILLDTSDMDFDTAVKAVKDIIENKAGKD